MNVVLKNIDAVNAIVTITISKDDYAEKVEKKLKEYRKKANIPGFRPGMTPMNLVKKMYGKGVLAEEVNQLISDTLYNHIKENNLNILGEPLPNETEQKPVNFDSEDDFEFVFDLAIAPELDINLTAKDKIAYYDITVNEEMVNNQIKSYTSRFGSYEQTDEVAENDVIKGQLLELNADKKVNEAGIKVADAVLSPVHIKDAKQKKAFVGAKKGDVITFNPQKAMENEADLASFLKISKDAVKDVTADFSFEIQQITRYNESPVDQSLFDKVFGEGKVKDEKEFRALIAEGVKESYVSDSDYKFGIDAKEVLVKKLDKVVFPEAFLKRWVLAANENLTAETVEKEFDLMLNDLKWYLIKNQIAKANACKVEKADIEAFARKMAKIQFAQYGMLNVPEDILANYAQDMLKKEETIKNMVEKVLEEKVLEVVKASVKLDKKAISYEDFNKMFE